MDPATDLSHHPPRGSGRSARASTRVARPHAQAPAPAPYEAEAPVLALKKGQLIDLITVRSSPHWIPALVTDVSDGGWRVCVTAFEVRSRGGYKYYNLDLGSSNDCNCMSPLGTYTGMTEDDIEASGGLEAIAAIRNGVDRPAPAPEPVPRAALTVEESRRLARQAARGIGKGTGNKLVDGDGAAGTADPTSPKPAMPHPLTKPKVPDTNPLNRTESAARAEAARLASSPPAVGDFLDVRCPDYRWRAGQVTSVRFSPDDAAPERAVITCEITCITGSSEEPTTVQFTHSAAIESLDFAPHSQYSDVTIHEYSAGQIVDCKDIFSNTQGAVRSMWRPAEIRATTNDSILVHFLNWDVKWDVWLNMHCDSGRLAPVGSRTDDETQQQQLSRQLDQEFIDTMLSNGLRVVRVASDGSCLFRAIAHQVYGAPDMHAKVRADVIEHIRTHAGRFALVAAMVAEPEAATTPAGADIDSALARYLERLKPDAAWGGDPEVMAAEELFDREIVLYSSDDFERNGAITTMSRMDHPALSLPSDRDPIRLSYHGSKHYNSVELVDQEPLAVRKGLGSADWGGVLATQRNLAFGKTGGAVSPMSKLVMSPAASDGTPAGSAAGSAAGGAAAKPAATAFRCDDDKATDAPTSLEQTAGVDAGAAMAGFSAGASATVGPAADAPPKE